MIRFVSILLVCAALAGCASKPKEAKAVPANPPPQHKATAVVVEPPRKNRVLPFNGRIAGVIEKLRFVIIDFSSSRRPELDQRLSVYRVGQKVAEIKVCGPYHNLTVAADIVAGEVKYGDEVKAE